MAVLILFAAGFLGRQGAKLVSSAKSRPEKGKYSVVIDVGHGGIDSGKVSADGVLEKDVNLAIAKKLKVLLEQEDVSVTLTRESDTGLYHESDSNKKVADLQNRCALIEKTDPDCTVSIHQNSFPQQNISGGQIFYHRGSEAGKVAAAILQKAIGELQTENHRQPKANDDYYLLVHTDTPTVIAECGFLTNPEECELLCDEEYQEQLAWKLYMGIIRYLRKR